MDFHFLSRISRDRTASSGANFKLHLRLQTSLGIPVWRRFGGREEAVLASMCAGGAAASPIAAKASSNRAAMF
jgi:hypothetical protein